MNSATTEILYGIHPVLEGLRAGRRPFVEIYVAKDKPARRLEAVFKAADAAKVAVRKIEASRLTALVDSGQHQGVAARVGAYPLVSVAALIDGPRSGPDGFLLLLDTIVDPHNLGALARTALCAGVDGIIIPKDRSAAPTPTVSKASAGALEHVRVARVVNMANTIKALKDKGFWIVGLDRDAERSLFAADLTGPLALVVGGEEKGVRPLVQKQCDLVVSIPQHGALNSLNASVAGAVAMYEVLRQRMASRQRTASPDGSRS